MTGFWQHNNNDINDQLKNRHIFLSSLTGMVDAHTKMEMFELLSFLMNTFYYFCKYPLYGTQHSFAYCEKTVRKKNVLSHNACFTA